MAEFWVGSIACRVVEYGRGWGSPEWLFPTVPAGELAPEMAPHLDEGGRLEFSYSSLLVRSGDRVALLDTGFPQPGEPWPAALGAALRSLGVAPRDVDAVVTSHGHPDHVGGLTRPTRAGGRRPAFATARHLVAAAELDYWLGHSDPGPAEHLQQVQAAGLVEPVDGEVEVLPGIRVLPTPGHTPGHLAVAITSHRQSALYVGDALAHEVNLAHPDWNHFSDMLPGLAARSRRRLVERAARDRSIIVASHVPRLLRTATPAPL